ncbi:hypothetical protein BKA69DRAFT_610357 [Paraphysoderma sedebokerense]|nr:hypothetical protein BKA69DRAFT_610357 [Paraphysoderma sedebokerense]
MCQSDACVVFHSLVPISIIIGVHLYVRKVVDFQRIPRSIWLSFASGVSISYIIIYAFSVLQSHRRRIQFIVVSETFTDRLFFVSMFVAFTIFYVLETFTNRSRKSDDEIAIKYTLESATWHNVHNERLRLIRRPFPEDPPHEILPDLQRGYFTLNDARNRSYVIKLSNPGGCSSPTLDNESVSTFPSVSQSLPLSYVDPMVISPPSISSHCSTLTVPSPTANYQNCVSDKNTDSTITICEHANYIETSIMPNHNHSSISSSQIFPSSNPPRNTFIVPPRSSQLKGRRTTTAFLISLIPFSIFMFIVGHLTSQRLRNRGIAEMYKYSVAIITLVIVHDASLRDHFQYRYALYGKYVLAVTTLAGWLVGCFVRTPEWILGIMIAFLLGGTMLNIIKDELPVTEPHNVWAFLIGSYGYGMFLLFVPT